MVMPSQGLTRAYGVGTDTVMADRLCLWVFVPDLGASGPTWAYTLDKDFRPYCTPRSCRYLDYQNQEMRLELTSRTDLALRAMRQLRISGARESRAILASELRTSPDFLARVMAPLVDQGWVDSRPGRSGGYLLSDEAERISVLDVIQVTEGVPVDRCVLRSGPCEPDEKCALHDPWTKARDALLAELSVSPAIAPAF